MMPVHLVFLVTDIFVYDFELFAILFDVVFLWLNFYNYMTLNKITVIIELVAYALAVVIALTHLTRVMFDQPEWTPLFIYILQYIVTYVGAGGYIGFRFKIHFEQQNNYKHEQKQKTLKGRIQLKTQKVGQAKLQPIIKNRLNSILYDPSDEEDYQEENKNVEELQPVEKKDSKAKQKIKDFKQ